MRHILLYNQRSLPLVARRENAALTHETYTSIQPEESPPGGQERECIFKMRLHFSGPECAYWLQPCLQNTTFPLFETGKAFGGKYNEEY